MPTAAATQIQITGTLLAILIATVVGIVVITASITFNIRSRRSSMESLIRDLMNNDAILTGKADEGSVGKELLAILREQEGYRQGKPTIADRIVDSVDWDVAGLIGIAVTFFLLFAVAGGIDVPTQILGGWLTIIGFYFGRNTAGR